MNLPDRVQSAIDAGLAAASSSQPASVLVRAALRVAVLRGDPLGEFWLGIEANGVREGHKQAALDLRGRLVALVGAEEADIQREAAFSALMSRHKVSQQGEDAYSSYGVGEHESHHLAMQAMYDEEVTAGLSEIETARAVAARDKMRATLMPTLWEQRQTLERVRAAAYEYLLTAESEVLRGQTIPDVLAQGQRFVESQLSALSPEALAALLAAQDRLAEGTAESLSQAATSCRRAIKSLADVLYPPGEPTTDDDGVTRVMDEPHYRNRLVEFVHRQRGRSAHADLLAGNITALGTRLKSLDDLASKGVHTIVGQAEAESCVSWTYMLAADLLRIYHETLAQAQA